MFLSVWSGLRKRISWVGHKKKLLTCFICMSLGASINYKTLLGGGISKKPRCATWEEEGLYLSYVASYTYSKSMFVEIKYKIIFEIYHLADEDMEK